MGDEKFTVIRDTREKDNFGFYFDEDPYCAGTLRTKLAYGDYSIVGLEDRFTIERKESVAEIAKNFVEDRFWKEVEVLSMMEFSYFIFEFSWNDIAGYPHNLNLAKKIKDKIKIRPPFIFSKILSLTIDYNIPVIFAGNKMSAEDATYAIIKKVYKKCTT